MKNTLKIIADCQALGVLLSLSNGKIEIASHHERLPSGWSIVLDRLVAHKMEVMEDLAELEARAAILEYDGGLTRSQAEQQAFQELAAVGDGRVRGQDLQQIKQWRGSIQSLPRANNQEGARLVKYALAFLDSPLCLEAVSLGWDAVSLFGMFNGGYKAATRRHDAMGLVPSLVWSKIRGKLSGITENIIRLDSEAAYLEMKAINDKSGTPRKRSRILTGASFAVPFWENQHFMGEI